MSTAYLPVDHIPLRTNGPEEGPLAREERYYID
jgi:hypothetical protein